MVQIPELYYRYNPWWEADYSLLNVIERPALLNSLINSLQNNSIMIITGLRRIGKTTLMKMMIQHLLNSKKIKPLNIFYISLDDYQIKEKSIFQIIDEYRQLHKLTGSEHIYIFLDEITYKKDFEQQLKNIYDSQNAKVFISSSSSSILRSKKPFLTGRNLVIEVMPLDFDEYLKFKKINILKSDIQLFESYFEDFLKDGGIPEYVLKGNIDYLKELINDIIAKDIAAFHKLKDMSLIEDLFSLLMERAGKQISINKLSKILNISPDTGRRYVNMFIDTYLIYLIPKWGKPNERILRPKKLYAADLGIRNYATGYKDKGSLFENYVFQKIKNTKLYYVNKDGIEIDFITQKRTLIEVKYNTDLEGKQKDLFDNFPADKRVFINNYYDLKYLKDIT